MKHIGKRFLALLTSGAAAAGMISAFPLPAGAEDFVHGVPRKVLYGAKLVEGAGSESRHFYYSEGEDEYNYSYFVLDDYPDYISCSTYAYFILTLPPSWDAANAAERLSQIVKKAGHSEYIYTDHSQYGEPNNTADHFYFGIYDRNRDDDFYSIIANLNDYLPQLGFSVDGVYYYTDYGVTNGFNPNAFGGYTDLDEDTAGRVSSYLQSIDSSLSLHRDGDVFYVVRGGETSDYKVSRYYPELAKEFGIWPKGCETTNASPDNPESWDSIAKLAGNIPDAEIQAVKTEYRVPDYCASFQLKLTDDTLKSLAEKLGVPAPAEGQPLDCSLLAEVLDTGFAAIIMPDPTRTADGYSYLVMLNSTHKGIRDMAAKLIAFIKKNGTEISSVAPDSVVPASTPERIGSWKRIDGLHEYYAANGKSLSPDKRYYYDEESGGIVEISRAGNPGMTFTLKADGKESTNIQQGRIAAMIKQFFGPGCKISSRPIYMTAAGVWTYDPVIDAIRYEITFPEMTNDLQETAEKLYRELAAGGSTVSDCMFYPDFGWVNGVIPNYYQYNAAQAEAISSYLAANEPDYTLTFNENRSTMTISSKSAENPKDSAFVYGKVFEALGYWPDSMAIEDGSGHGLGTDLTKTVTAEKRTCQWESAEEQSPFYKNFRFFTSSEGNYTKPYPYDAYPSETYTQGNGIYIFSLYQGYLGFRLSRSLTGNDTFSYEEFNNLIKQYLHTNHCNMVGYNTYAVQFSPDQVKAEDISAFKQALAGTGILSAFYEPGDVATISRTTLSTNKYLYYSDTMSGETTTTGEAIIAWLTEYRPDCTYEEHVQDSEAGYGSPYPSFFKVIPKEQMSASELTDLACDLYRLTGQWPEMIHYLGEPEYAFRNSSYTPASSESKGESCEWLRTLTTVDSFEKRWGDYTRFDAKGMFGDDAEVYIISYDGSSTLTVFTPIRNAVGCHTAYIDRFEALLPQIRSIVSPFCVSAVEQHEFMIIQPQNGKDAMTQTDVQKIRDALTEDGLIRTFFKPGDVAEVSYYGPADSNALYYLKDNMQNADQVLAAMKKWLAENREGYQAEITQSRELGRTDTPYIKVTPKTKISNAELFALAADLYEVTGATPAFSQQLPNIPEYAVRNNSYSVRGDLNQDGQADVADAVMLARYLAEDTELKITDNGLKNADVQGNGSVSTEDLTMLLRVIAKQIQL